MDNGWVIYFQLPKLSPKVLNRRLRLDFSVRKRIAIEYDKYEEDVINFVVPQKHPEEIFPYVHPRWLMAGNLGAHGYEVAITSEILNIKSFLLYYHVRCLKPLLIEIICIMKFVLKRM